MYVYVCKIYSRIYVDWFISEDNLFVPKKGKQRINEKNTVLNNMVSKTHTYTHYLYTYTGRIIFHIEFKSKSPSRSSNPKCILKDQISCENNKIKI